MSVLVLDAGNSIVRRSPRYIITDQFLAILCLDGNSKLAEPLSNQPKGWSCIVHITQIFYLRFLLKFLSIAFPLKSGRSKIGKKRNWPTLDKQKGW